MTVEEWLGKDNQLGIDIWNKKYRYNNETFDEWLDRVSGKDDDVKRLIRDRKFLFGGRTLANRWVDNGANFFNCFSRGFIEDDYKDIMGACTDIGLTFKAQGGQGLSLTKLRPKGTPIGKMYKSDGIVPFMKIYNEVTAGTSQGGSRKGALMMSIDARHKEAETFIKIKSELGMIEQANLSLEVDDEFMEAVDTYYKTGEVVTLHEKRDYSGHIVEYDVTPINIFKMMVDNCYDWGDPALLYVNRFRNFNIMEFDDDYQIETSNPCGEQPLPKHGACCLASLNLSEFVKNPYTDKAEFDFEEFEKAVHIGIKALDKLIDENYYRQPLKEQQEMSFNYRNVGLGAFGYATMLMKMGMKYGGEQAVEFTDGLFFSMFREAVKESNNLAKEFGTFPKYKDVVWESSIIKEHFTPEEIGEMKNYGLRNCSLLSIAPNGSLATLLGESGGCEPEYAIQYMRRTVGMTDGKDKYYTVYCRAAREYKELYHTDKLPEYFVSSAEIPWNGRILTQGVMQDHIDTAISSTVNLPNSATKEEVAEIYLNAWKCELKGITIFRDGCKKVGILTTDSSDTDTTKTDIKQTADVLPRGAIIECSSDLVGKKRKLQTGCGSLHVLAYFDPVSGEMQEVYLSKGSTGGCANFMTGLSRTISLLCRAGVDIETIKDQLDSTGVCPSYATRSATKHDTSKGSCCPMAIGNALMDMWKEMQDDISDNTDDLLDTEEQIIDSDISVDFDISKLTYDEKISRRICPECGGKLSDTGGCIQCFVCGRFTKCS